MKLHLGPGERLSKLERHFQKLVLRISNAAIASHSEGRAMPLNKKNRLLRQARRLDAMAGHKLNRRDSARIKETKKREGIAGEIAWRLSHVKTSKK